MHKATNALGLWDARGLIYIPANGGGSVAMVSEK